VGALLHGLSVPISEQRTICAIKPRLYNASFRPKISIVRILIDEKLEKR
jgi:hypothetical protein